MLDLLKKAGVPMPSDVLAGMLAQRLLALPLRPPSQNYILGKVRIHFSSGVSWAGVGRFYLWSGDILVNEERVLLSRHSARLLSRAATKHYLLCVEHQKSRRKYEQEARALEAVEEMLG